LKCSDLNPEKYRGKKLVWFNGESEEHFKLSPSVSVDGRSFILTATAADFKNTKETDVFDRGNYKTRQIDAATVHKMDEPISEDLRPFCDFVIFDNSPKAEARFSMESQSV
jgi:hypothetical protein